MIYCWNINQLLFYRHTCQMLRETVAIYTGPKTTPKKKKLFCKNYICFCVSLYEFDIYFCCYCRHACIQSLASLYEALLGHQ